MPTANYVEQKADAVLNYDDGLQADRLIKRM